MSAARRLIIVSGCSGGGKSTLVQALAAEGFATVPEPGRRIVAEELAGDGSALPWIDPVGFARRAVALSLVDLEGVQAQTGTVILDRGLGDALAALEFASGVVPDLVGTLRARFDRRVFMAPPWPQIFVPDPERRHGFQHAVAEHDRLVAFYTRLGFDLVTLPKVPVPERVAFVRRELLL